MNHHQIFYVGAFWEKVGVDNTASASTSASSDDDSTSGLDNFEESIRKAQDDAKASETTATIASTADTVTAVTESKIADPLDPKEASEKAAAEQLKQLETVFLSNKKDKDGKDGKDGKDKLKEDETTSDSKTPGKNARRRSSSEPRGSQASVAPATLAHIHQVGVMCRVYWQQNTLADSHVMLALIGLHRIKATGVVQVCKLLFRVWSVCVCGCGCVWVCSDGNQKVVGNESQLDSISFVLLGVCVCVWRCLLQDVPTSKSKDKGKYVHKEKESAAQAPMLVSVEHYPQPNLVQDDQCTVRERESIVCN